MLSLKKFINFKIGKYRVVNLVLNIYIITIKLRQVKSGWAQARVTQARVIEQVQIRARKTIAKKKLKQV